VKVANCCRSLLVTAVQADLLSISKRQHLVTSHHHSSQENIDKVVYIEHSNLLRVARCDYLWHKPSVSAIIVGHGEYQTAYQDPKIDSGHHVLFLSFSRHLVPIGTGILENLPFLGYLIV
jgi:hypothetical protein